VIDVLCSFLGWEGCSRREEKLTSSS
jgi:hypothetical protein